VWGVLPQEGEKGKRGREPTVFYWILQVGENQYFSLLAQGGKGEDFMATTGEGFKRAKEGPLD